MPRIRSIKPEFPHSETIGRLSRDGRLLFILLWTVVDDDGRTRAASRMLASLLYPYDDDAPRKIGGWLNELEAEGCIRRYEVEGSLYLDIPKWLTHQKIDRPSASRLPSFDARSVHPREDSRGSDADLGPRTLDQDLGGDHLRSVADATRPVASDGFQRFKQAYPKREGSNPWKPAEKKFTALVRSGVDPEAMITAARAYGADLSKQTKIGTQFVAQAVTFLNQERFGDHAPTPALSPADRARMEAPPGAPSDEELRRKYGAKVAQCDSRPLLRGGDEGDAGEGSGTELQPSDREFRDTRVRGVG